ncbi:MAG TPA: 1-acyl-sn-glycerol-3-phosphate acyltransferase [Polyangiaceae bacterium]|jgi:glycerol-3-phosphate O-acyltransferase|nr:1-acyl-sn-glycerol-3-phosphate acyltransferase [Polyangiaceae bacterium]
MHERSTVKTYQPNVALRAVYRKFFDSIAVDPSWIRSVRDMAAKGTVVYVLRNLNFVDFLALDHLTKRFGLPQVRFANDLGLWILNPLGDGLIQALTPGASQSPAEELRSAVEDGGSAALFLKRPPGVLDLAAGATGGRGLKEGDELIRTLLEVQRKDTSRPILLVPQVFVWTKRPDTRGTRAFDFLVGPREWPSSLRTMWQLLGNYRHVQLKAGEPLDLRAYLESAGNSSDETNVRRVVYAILRRLERERRSVTGPAEKPPDRVREELLRSPKLQGTMRTLSTTKHEDLREITEKAASMLKKLQAAPDVATIGALAVFLDRVFHKIYAGIDVDREGLERVREATKEGCVVLLPSHKSHIDYLVLSYVFNDENIQLPLIAAGDNLSFFPLGPIFRRAGAFFIRRSFKGDRLYSSVVHTYVRRLIRDGYPLELFVEGARSRTGKLLPPKFGLLGMIVESALTVPQRVAYFVPVSIGYERIVETGAYERELSGGEKVKEDAAGLLRTREVLRHRYGRISLQFGATLTLDDIRDDLRLRHGSDLSPPQRRSLVTRLGNRVMDEINRVTAVTPGSLTAIALLSHGYRGLPHDELVERCSRLLTVLRESGARTTPSTTTPQGELRPEAIREAAQLFTDADLIEAHAPAEPDGEAQGPGVIGPETIYTIPDSKRLELDTSKNMILHFFVERSLVSAALLATPAAPLPKDVVRDRVQRLSRLFKHEFRFRADAPFAEIFEDTLASMQLASELTVDAEGRIDAGPGRLGWSGREWLLTYAAFLRNFLESYRIAARGLGALLKGPLPEKELIKKTLQTGKRMFFTGEVERPEAVSQPTLKNAFASFTDQGILRSDGGKLELVIATPDAVKSAELLVLSYVDREVPE